VEIQLTQRDKVLRLQWPSHYRKKLWHKILVDVKIAKGGADYFLAKGVNIPPNSAIELIQGGAKIVLESGDVLEAVSDTASSLDVVMSYIDTISS